MKPFEQAQPPGAVPQPRSSPVKAARRATDPARVADVGQAHATPRADGTEEALTARVQGGGGAPARGVSGAGGGVGDAGWEAERWVPGGRQVGGADEDVGGDDVGMHGRAGLRDGRAGTGGADGRAAVGAF